MDTQDPLDTVIKFDSTVPFVLASGDYSTEWEQRVEHGRIDLRFDQLVQQSTTNDIDSGTGEVKLTDDVDEVDAVVEEKLSFNESRNKT